MERPNGADHYRVVRHLLYPHRIAQPAFIFSKVDSSAVQGTGSLDPAKLECFSR